MPKMLSAKRILQGHAFQQKGKLRYVVDSVVGIQRISQPSCKTAFLSQRMKRIQSPLILYSPDLWVASVLNSLSRIRLMDKNMGEVLYLNTSSKFPKPWKNSSTKCFHLKTYLSRSQHLFILMTIMFLPLF